MDKQQPLPPLRQATLSFHHTGRFNAARPGPLIQPDRPLPAANVQSRRRRRKVGGINEAEIIRAFQRTHDDMTNGGIDPDASSGEESPSIKKRRRGYTREEKLQAISYLENTDIPGKRGAPDKAVTLIWAGKVLQVDRHSLRDWRRDKVKILKMKKGAKRQRGICVGREPVLEFQLHEKFVTARGIGQIISGGWFLKHAKAIYRGLYPRRVTQDEVSGRYEYEYFSFSGTWFAGFRRRYRIALRCKTKQAQKPPEDFRPKIEQWLKFNRRNTIIGPGSVVGKGRIPGPTVGRFKLSEIANMDQTPIAFEFLSGRTYDQKGAKTIWIKEQRSGWDRRQATLQVCVYADGVRRCKPLLIFHGDPVGDSRRRKEEKLYDKGVYVTFNKTAWADSTNLKDWVKKQYGPASTYFAAEREPRFLSLDAFAPQMTAKVRAEFDKLLCTTSYIPGGCTGFVQVLDVALNKLLKALIAQAASDHADKHFDKYEAGGFTVGDRRVLLTQWVAEAWEELHLRYKETIIRTFRQVGLSLNPDGGEDGELKVKGLPDVAVGDFARVEPEPENGLGSLLAEDVKTVEVAQAKCAQRVAQHQAKRVRKIAKNDARIKAGKVFPEYADPNAEGFDPNNLPDAITGEKASEEESSDDDEEHEEVTTLGRMATRSQTRVSRYYTGAEPINMDSEDEEDFLFVGDNPVEQVDLTVEDDEHPEFDDEEEEDNGFVYNNKD